MKRVFWIFALGLIIECVHAQQYYNMWRGVGDSGKPEWIANFSMATGDRVTGIDFTTSSTNRGFVNGSGRWGFRKPGTHLDPHSFSNIINAISNLTVGVEGWLCAEGLSVRTLFDGVTNTLDMLTTGQRSTITSNGDSEGLHIKSAIGKKIYIYDTAYFNDKAWMTIGPGRNNDPAINNSNSKMLRIGSNAGIGLWSNGKAGVDDTPNFWLTGDGNVRIGTLTTSYKLNVAGGIYSENSGVKTLIGLDSDSSNLWLGTKSNHGLYLGTNNKSSLYIDGGTTNNVYVGLTDTEVAAIHTELKSKYKLFVNKGILAVDYSIAPKSSWSDFVFDASYELRKIEEIEAFVVKNKHLPDVPSAKQVAEKGYSQHDMNKILLQKIEELTLYTIQQQKEIQELKTELSNLKK